MNSLLEQIAANGFWDWFTVATSLAYVYLAARDNNWCWAFAFMSTAVWAYQSFFVYELVSDALLQVFYCVMAVVGIYRWRAKAGKTATLSITRMSGQQHAITLATMLGGGLLLGYFFDASAISAAATYPDAITSVGSVVTTFLLIGRKLENWLYWIVIDLVYVWIYQGQEAILFAILMILYVVMAVYGYFQWQKEMVVPNLP